MKHWRISKRSIETSKQRRRISIQYRSCWTNNSSSICETNWSTEATSNVCSWKNFQTLTKSCIRSKTKQSDQRFKQTLKRESKNDCVWMLMSFKIYFQNTNKMPIEWITEYETQPLFKIFLKRIWFKNFDEYIELFWDDLEKRKEAVRRFKKTYPNFRLNNQQEKWKTS